MARWRLAIVVDVEAPEDAHDDLLFTVGMAVADAAHVMDGVTVRGVCSSEADAQLWSHEIGLVPDR